MRTASLRTAGTPIGRISEVAAEQVRRHRLRVAERAEVVAVHAGDDWFELFADEKEVAPPAAVPSILPPEPSQPAVTAPEAPDWLRLALLRWRFGPWPGIAGATGIVLSAVILVLGARSLGGSSTPEPADIRRTSDVGATSSATQLVQPAAEVAPAPAPAPAISGLSAPRPPVMARNFS